MAGRPRTFDREEALVQAMALFWEKGYEGSGLAEILDVTGMARQSLYNTFGDKKKLFVEALQMYCDGLTEMVQEHLDRSGTAYENLCDLVFSMADTSGETSRMGDLMVNTMVEFAGRDAEVASVLNSTWAKLENQVQKTVELAQAQGDLPPTVRPRRAALDIVNSINGMQFMRRAGRDSTEIREVAEATIEGIAYIG